MEDDEALFAQGDFENFLVKWEDDYQELSDHLDQLITDAEFLTHCHAELHRFSKRLHSLEALAKAIPEQQDGFDTNFARGMLWTGAVAAYEGLLHHLLLHALAVNSLQRQIHEYGRIRYADKAKRPPQLKGTTDEAIRRWLTTRTITDPRTIATDLAGIFKIELDQPDPELCKRMLGVRNLFTHRGLGCEVTANELLQVLSALDAFAATFATTIAGQLDANKRTR